jgi:heme oxygenase (mycobilin-producing)
MATLVRLWFSTHSFQPRPSPEIGREYPILARRCRTVEPVDYRIRKGAVVATIAVLDLQVKADSLETAHQVIHATLTDTRAFPGCLGVTVLIDSDDSAHVVVYETWESIEHDRAYRAWRATPEGVSDLGSILAARKLTQFTVAEGV